MGGIDGERVDIGDIVIMFVCSYDKKKTYWDCRVQIYEDQLDITALPRVLIVTSAVYPRLIVNYDFSSKLGRLNLKSQNQAKEHFPNSSEFPNQTVRQPGQTVRQPDQTVRQPGQGVPKLRLDIQTNRHPKVLTLYIQIHKYPNSQNCLNTQV